MGLIHGFLDLLYGSTPVEFESSFGLDESITRLEQASAGAFLSPLTPQRAIGTVSESHVSIHRNIPRFRNSFKTYFIGHFLIRNERVVLVGRFTMLWFVKAFLTIWFGSCTLLTFVMLAKLPKMQPDKWWIPLYGVGMFCAGIVFVRWAKWLSQDDPAWLSEIIKDALSENIPDDDRA